MRSSTFLVSAFVVLFCGFQTLASPGQITSPERVFAPTGYDDDDQVELVLDGELPDRCQELDTTEVEADPAARVIRISQYIGWLPEARCALRPTSYSRVVQVGQLPAGLYTVEVLSEDGRFIPRTSFSVAGAPPNGGSLAHPYANITGFQISRLGGVADAEASTSSYALTIRGTFSSSCVQLVGLRTTVSPSNVIEVLPATAFMERTCIQTIQDFEANATLRGVKPGRYLIHIRAAAGRALNEVIDLR